MTIGGVTYNVEVEEVGAVGHAPVAASPVARPAAAPPLPAAPAAAPAPAAQAAVAAPAATAPAAARPEPAQNGEAVRAPLPGMVVGVKVEVGQAVKAGDVLLVLEAMKMENDITAPAAGTIMQLLVEKGTAVSLGDALAVIGK